MFFQSKIIFIIKLYNKKTIGIIFTIRIIKICMKNMKQNKMILSNSKI